MFAQKVALYLVVINFGVNLILGAVISNSKDVGSNSYRLTNESIPMNYFVHFSTDIHTERQGENFNYEGYVIIDIKIIRDTKILRLHERQINIHTIELRDSAKSEVLIKKFDSIVEFDFLNIELETELQASDEIYKLKITFTAPLRHIAQGFYRSMYKDSNNETHWLAATQFESTNARYAFPCYDEPGLKATFELEIKHHSSYTTISNYYGTRDNIDDDSEYVITKFDKTAKMSTYLLAFIVFDDYVSQNNLLSTPKQSVFTRSDAVGYAKLALDEGVKIIKALEDYVGIKYNLEKLDQATIPDVQKGEMGNWGLVTSNEELLLFNEQTGTLRQKLDIVTTIAHEYGHQFFGNLVTPKWWEYIWLNEGFATLMEYHLPHILYANERYMDLFVIEQQHLAMTTDGLKSTRPMTHYAESPAGISGLFDSIAYHKSGSVLRMIQHFLGDETFQKALKIYLDTHEFDVAVPDNLFNALLDANNENTKILADIDLIEVLNSWTLQKGYPLLTITRSADGKSINLSQEHFRYEKDEEESQQLWIIPFNYITKSKIDDGFEDTTVMGWMPKQSTFSLELMLDESEWIIFNKQQTGYYRVNYDVTTWELITNFLSSNNEAIEKIHPINRAQLIDDSFNLARAGIIPYDIPLNMSLYLANEMDYTPWAAANANFNYLQNLLAESEWYKLFGLHVSELTGAVIGKLGYTPKKDESNFDKLLRTVIVNWQCKMGSQECIDFIVESRNKYLQNQAIDNDLKEQIFCYGLDLRSWDLLINVLFKMEKDDAEASLLLNSLGCTENKFLLNLYLDITIDKVEGVIFRRTDRDRAFMSVLSKTKYGLEVTTSFVREYFDQIKNLYSGNKPLDRIVLSMASYVSSKSQADKFETEILNFLQDEIDASVIESAKQIISGRLGWLEDYGADIKTYLSSIYESEDDEDNDEENKDEDDDDDKDKDDDDDDDDAASTVLISINLLILLQIGIQLNTLF